MENLDLLPPEEKAAILAGPAAKPPTGYVPPNQTTMGMTVFFICFFITTTVALLRVYSRVFVTKHVKLEDYLGVASIGFYAGLCWIVIFSWRHNGYFVHEWNMTVGEQLDVVYAIYFLFIFYCGTMLFVKSAILLEWNRLFVVRGVRDTFFWTCHALLALNVATYVSCGVAAALNCTPIESGWKPWIPHHCGDFRAITIAVATFNLLVDILILILPQWKVWGLSMSRGRKIGVSFIFSLGLLACGCAIGRLYESLTVKFPGGDLSYEISRTSLWIIAECTCVIMVFCIPAITRLLTQGSALGRVYTSLRTWTRRTLLRSGDNSGVRVEDQYMSPPTIGSEPRKHIYHHMSDNDGSISLADLNTKPRASDIEAQPSSPTGVLRTTDFERREETASRHTTDSTRAKRQHPWMTK